MDSKVISENEKSVVVEDNKSEITIKTAKGLVSDPFVAKDGKEYCQVKIPNKDENDKSGWGTFVVRAANIREDKFGKGMYFKVPENGTTTISKSELIGKDQMGKNVYVKKSERVTNRELKNMVEFYKDRDKNLTQDKKETPILDNMKSFKEQLDGAKKEAAEKNNSKLKSAKAKGKEQSI